ncbi:helix-turn-helix transcriptional regulator [Aquibacillus sp. 3ASR75-11]|uniref:Helix-turn-helix transcriptional regulator n=1 Tax=Terrihalobacillus insolitus TaxID=2950438 RepID=A0A9X4AMC2_9BACI|nr:helix-turn-helix transcriptional regulator [Terrihalobacillus insolitus]MDC3413436.1 helix-turn-helix transcriptional regulator [Terrihalobacillus insolitus]MDC3425272.1 helix-turn-helix transcriptional regulator [Terrihalobacillus insolitus]
MNLENIAYNIKFFREQNEWTQKQLAEILTISRSVVAKWENGSVIPDIKSLIELSSAFNISLDYLVGIHTPRKDLLKEFKRAYGSNKEMDEEIVDIIEYVLKHPAFKEQLLRMQNFSVKKQKSLHTLFQNIIDEFDRV